MYDLINWVDHHQLPDICTLKVGNVDGCVSVLFFLSGGVVAVVLIFLVGMEVESPTPSDAF
jgi:hypothetical protein